MQYSPKEIKQFGSYAFFFILFLVAALLLGLGHYGLFDVKEAHHAQTALEMRASGVYGAPTFNGVAHATPPFIYWAQSFSMQFWGETPFGARFPSAFFAFLSVLALYLFSERLTRNPSYALLTSVAFGLTFALIGAGRSATGDMAAFFFSFAATMTLVANLYATNRSNVAVFVAGVLLAAGFLSQGVSAFFFPVVFVTLVACLKPGAWGHTLKCVNPALLLVGVLVGLFPWSQMVISEKGADYFITLMRSQYMPFSGAGAEAGVAPFYMLWRVLIGAFPWVLFLPNALLLLVPQMRQLYRSEDMAAVLPVMGVLWLGVALVYGVLIAPSALQAVLMFLPGVAFCVAARLDILSNAPLGRLTWFWALPPTVLLAAACVLLKWLPAAAVGVSFKGLNHMMAQLFTALHMPSPVQNPLLVDILVQPLDVGILGVSIAALLLVGVAVSVQMMCRGHFQGVMLLTACMWMAVVLVMVGGGRVAYTLLQRPLEQQATTLGEQYEKGDTVYAVALERPSVRLLSGVPYRLLAPEQVMEVANRPHSGNVFYLYDVRQRHVVSEALGTQKRRHNCTGGYCLTLVPAPQL